MSSLRCAYVIDWWACCIVSMRARFLVAENHLSVTGDICLLSDARVSYSDHSILVVGLRPLEDWLIQHYADNAEHDPWPSTGFFPVSRHMPWWGSEFIFSFVIPDLSDLQELCKLSTDLLYTCVTFSRYTARSQSNSWRSKPDHQFHTRNELQLRHVHCVCLSTTLVLEAQPGGNWVNTF